MPSGKEPAYQIVDGLIYSTMLVPDVLQSAINYKPQPKDLFIVTYPKCGSNWLQYIIYLIYNKGIPPSDFLHFLQCSPFLELTGPEALLNMPGPGGIKTHLPLHILSILPEAKYIYVARNPKDCCASFYHHHTNFVAYDFSEGEFEVFFDLFLQGKVECGDYFDHLIPWYEQRHLPNVLFLTYEGLKKNFRSSVLKIANFLGDEYGKLLETDEQVLSKVTYHSSFEYMKSTLNPAIQELYSQITKTSPETLPPWMAALVKVSNESQGNVLNKGFIRKGLIGDWKNLFTKVQQERMDLWIQQRTKESDVMNLWNDVPEIKSS